MAYDLAKVTANGNNLIAQILANKSSLSIDKIEISDTQLPSTTDISTMTSVPKVVQTVSANGFSKNSNTLIISTVVDNSSIRADYKAWVFGIWGSDSQNGQSQLIAVITSTNSPDTIPAFSGSTPVSYTYKFNIGFSNASKIQFNMISDSFATNDTVVHTTGDETIDGQKKFKTDPTDSAGNAYAKTVDVNQQLDKKVNIADMRKPASDVAGIEEVNAKQDKIGYTPADDSKVAHLSGANNFDTVPTVKNNPLLLASSLPSDLARTGQDTNFTGKLQKSGIDVATTTDVTNAVNTATSNVVTTDKLANFTAGLQSGGVSVATSDDLKSVEDSAWRQLDQKYINTDAFSDAEFCYKINRDKKIIKFFGLGNVNLAQDSGETTLWFVDLSSIIKTSGDRGYGKVGAFPQISGLSVRVFFSELYSQLENKKLGFEYATDSQYSGYLFSASDPNSGSGIYYDELQPGI